MAHGIKYIEISPSSNGIPLLSHLAPISNNFADTSAIENRNTTGADQPRLIYCENVLPTNNGVNSTYPLVFANSVVDGEITTLVDYSNSKRVEAFTVVDGNRNKAIQVCSVGNEGVDGVDYNNNGEGFSYQSVTMEGLLNLGEDTEYAFTFNEVRGVTLGTVYADTGTSQTLIPFRVNSLANGSTSWDNISSEFSELTLSGSSDVIKGFAYSFGYLIAYTDTAILWSSVSDPYDLVPSEITGAGSAIPDGLKGIIVGIRNTDVGFNIYTTNGILSARLGSNTVTPFIFRPINLHAGVNSMNSVSDGYPQFAVTSSGLLAVTSAEAKPVLPEISDFITSGYYETYDAETKEIVQTRTPDPLEVKLTYVNDRYLCISYKVKGAQYYSHFLIVDTQYNSFGKIAINHLDVFALDVSVLGDFLSYDDLLAEGLTYEELQHISYAMLRHSSGDTAPKQGYTIGVVQADGNLSVIDPSWSNNSEKGIAVFGNFSIKRGLVTEFQRAEVNYSEEDQTLIATIRPSYEGKKSDATVAMYPFAASGGHKEFVCMVTGVSHQLHLEGAFVLNKLTVGIRGMGYR